MRLFAKQRDLDWRVVATAPAFGSFNSVQCLLAGGGDELVWEVSRSLGAVVFTFVDGPALSQLVPFPFF
jgi:hypothetical protein